MVLFLDEFDALQGNSMVSILSQLRDGHNARPERHPFPASIVLCGLRDVRDYKVASGSDPDRVNPASPFDIIAKSLRMGDFTADQIAELYDQHTEATGQEFTKDAVDRVFELTQGQPWLVNALAHECVHEMGLKGTVTTAHVEDAKERLIRARATHLDSLVARLHEPRVERVIEPIVAGAAPGLDSAFDHAVSYVHDLGLIRDTRTLEIANPIYREVLSGCWATAPSGSSARTRAAYSPALPGAGRRTAHAARGHGAQGLAGGRERPAARGPGPARPLPRPAHPPHRQTRHLRPPPRSTAVAGARRVRGGGHAVRPTGHRTARVTSWGGLRGCRGGGAGDQ
ncbi:hypothetical protein ACFMQL_22870 [Nonomuraea fastidiosa]|uniref:hypothetical protein n=1 Tax=Nonomuraea TaxID=83681 RepID=UPI003427CB21